MVSLYSDIPYSAIVSDPSKNQGHGRGNGRKITAVWADLHVIHDGAF